MSEQLQDVNAQSASPQMAQPAPATLNPEQFESIKRSLIDNLHKHYSTFITSICQFPCAQLPMQEAFRHFDTGFLWFEKSIVNMPMPQVQVAQAPQSQAPSEQEMAPTNEAASQAPEEMTQPAV